MREATSSSFEVMHASLTLRFLNYKFGVLTILLSIAKQLRVMNATTLDLDTLRTLVLAADLGSHAQAAARLARTPSAISLQMKRLQADVGATLFRKRGRRVVLTEAGEIALRFARRMVALNDELMDTIRGASLAGSVRLGCSQDFADTVLPRVLSQFTTLYPLVQMEVHIEGNATLVESLEKGNLDVALTVGQADRPTAEIIGDMALVWIAGRDFSPRSGQPLPLVVLGPQCVFRKRATQLLDESSTSWRVAAVSPSLSGLWAAAVGGLGLTARSALGLPGALVSGERLFGLPALGTFPICLHARRERMSSGVERLRAIVRDEVTRVRRSKKPRAHSRIPFTTT
jgi:DNA-binding transcriptional LysR family regulator